MIVPEDPNDFAVLKPDGKSLCFDARIGLPSKEHGVAAFTTLEPVLIAVLHGPERGRAKLDSFIHEALHHALSTHGHSVVGPMTTFLTDVLWKAGYRRTCETSKKRKKRPAGAKPA